MWNQVSEGYGGKTWINHAGESGIQAGGTYNIMVRVWDDELRRRRDGQIPVH